MQVTGWTLTTPKIDRQVFSSALETMPKAAAATNHESIGATPLKALVLHDRDDEEAAGPAGKSRVGQKQLDFGASQDDKTDAETPISEVCMGVLNGGGLSPAGGRLVVP